MLIIDGVKYKLWTPKDEEKEFHPFIIKYSKIIFGENSLYLPIEKRLVSRAGRGVMPDGFAIIFSKVPEMYIVEVELSSHDLDKHIVEQLNRFGRAINNPKNQKVIADRLHKEIKSNLVREAFVRQMIGSKEIYKFLSDLVSQPPKIIILIEHKDAKVVEACEGLRISPKILQFKSFEREDAENVKAHLIEPLFGIGGIIEKRKERGKTKLPPHYKDWHSMRAWVDDNVRDILVLLTRRVVEIGEVNLVVHGRYLCFYIGEPSTKTIFAAFLLTKKTLKVRIRTQATKFEDRKKWTGDKVYKGWFFKKGQEREFRITGEEQIEYAMELISQAYSQTKRFAKIGKFLRKHKK